MNTKWLCDVNQRVARALAPCPRTQVLAEHVAARSAIEAWPSYAKTRLVDLDPASLGVERLVVKDETNRCGLGSFKALGGGLAVSDVESDTVATASAGNHGIAVAWAAMHRGLTCRVYLSSRVSEATEARLRDDLGARVVRRGDSYEASVAACFAEEAVVVQDKARSLDDPVVRRIHAGYSVLAAELLDECTPTHIVVNAGVGGLAAAVTSYAWARLGADRPRIVVVEPTQADCLRRLSRGHGAATLRGPTIQTGLDCHEACPLAWQTLETGVAAFAAVDDDLVLPAQRHLYAATGILAGESGVAGLALLVHATPHLKHQLQLDSHSRVAVIVCEADLQQES